MIKQFAKGFNFILGEFLHKSNVFVSGSLQYLDRKRNIDSNYFDYVRLATLELISHEINNKAYSGNVAELGVYKGKFARYINQYFPNRQLYLFDTFEGFDKKDVTVEKEKELSSGSQNFSDTSVEAVLSRMPFPDKCIPVKGYFPESVKDINDSFVFVSLDADLYAPIYKGLDFFYPKLVKGGYIFIHDFNNNEYKGSRKAVEQFCAEQNINFVPIPDFGGSAVIAK
ncbi:MAG: TylF/MycF/NovP-related O-methyltransferase [Chitinophagaceae bacterium]